MGGGFDVRRHSRAGGRAGEDADDERSGGDIRRIANVLRRKDDSRGAARVRPRPGEAHSIRRTRHSKGRSSGGILALDGSGLRRLHVRGASRTFGGARAAHDGGPRRYFRRTDIARSDGCQRDRVSHRRLCDGRAAERSDVVVHPRRRRGLRRRKNLRAGLRQDGVSPRNGSFATRFPSRPRFHGRGLEAPDGISGNLLGTARGSARSRGPQRASGHTRSGRRFLRDSLIRSHLPDAHKARLMLAL